jgi:hypothetical protein
VPITRAARDNPGAIVADSGAPVAAGPAPANGGGALVADRGGNVAGASPAPASRRMIRTNARPLLSGRPMNAPGERPR